MSSNLKQVVILKTQFVAVNYNSNALKWLCARLSQDTIKYEILTYFSDKIINKHHFAEYLKYSFSGSDEYNRLFVNCLVKKYPIPA